MDGKDFLKQQQQAVAQMKEMNRRATPSPEAKKSTENKHPLKPQQPPSQGFMGLDLPFMNLLKERDTALILGLLLILFSENADKRLLFALVYILL